MIEWNASDDDVKLEALARGGTTVYVPLVGQISEDQPDTARVEFPFPGAPLRYGTVERFRRTILHLVDGL